MDNKKLGFTNIDEYISLQDDNVKEILLKIREVVHDNAPEATEKISYQMPTFFYNGNLVHFAAFKNHIGFYPAPSGIVEFEEELRPYKHQKGSIRFLLKDEIPYELIGKIVAFRYKENQNRVL